MLTSAKGENEHRATKGPCVDEGSLNGTIARLRFDPRTAATAAIGSGCARRREEVVPAMVGVGAGVDAAVDNAAAALGTIKVEATATVAMAMFRTGRLVRVGMGGAAPAASAAPAAPAPAAPAPARVDGAGVGARVMAGIGTRV